MDLPKKKSHLESGLNQRDRATGGFVGVYTHRKPGKKIDVRGFGLLRFAASTIQPRDLPSTARSMMFGQSAGALTGALQFGHGAGGFANNFIHWLFHATPGVLTKQ